MFNRTQPCFHSSLWITESFETNKMTKFKLDDLYEKNTLCIHGDCFFISYYYYNKIKLQKTPLPIILHSSSDSRIWESSEAIGAVVRGPLMSQTSEGMALVCEALWCETSACQQMRQRFVKKRQVNRMIDPGFWETVMYTNPPSLSPSLHLYTSYW